MDASGEYIFPYETDMINSENFWRSVKRLISLIRSLRHVNADVLHTMNKADAVRAAHYDWSITRQELLRKIAFMKQLLMHQLPDEDSSGSREPAVLTDTSKRNRDQANTVIGPGSEKEEDIAPMETCKISSEVITPDSPPPFDTGVGRSSLFLNSASRITGTTSDPPMECTTPNSSLSTKRLKADFDEGKENDRAHTRMSPEGGNPPGPQDGLRSPGQRRFLIVESGAALDKHPFTHTWIYEDESIPRNAAHYSVSCPCPLKLAMVVSEISELLRVDKIFCSKLIKQWSKYVLSCGELLHTLAVLQSSDFLHHLMKEIVSSSFNPSSFPHGLVQEYEEMRASPVEILVDALGHLRATSHFKPVVDFIHQSLRYMQLVSLNRYSLLLLRISSGNQNTRKLSAFFLGYDAERLRDNTKDRLRQHESSVNTDLEAFISTMVETLLGHFNSSGNPELLNEVLDNMSAEVQTSLDIYESLKKLLFVQPTILQRIVSFGI